MRMIICFLLLSACATPTKKLTVIAHRGASGYLPEHTLEAAVLAHSWDVDFIEADVVMTKDDQLIVLHDLTLDTTTNVAEVFPAKKRRDGHFYAIDFTLAQIKKLEVYERFHPVTGKNIFPTRYPNKSSGFQIATFQEFIVLVQSLNERSGKKIGIYPEIKKPEFHLRAGKDITAAVIKMLRHYGYEDSKLALAIVQCFWPDSLKRLKFEFKTKLPLVQLIADNSWGESSADYEQMISPQGLFEVARYADGIGPSLGHIEKNKNLASSSRKLGMFVHAYTHRNDRLPQGLKPQEYVDHIRNRLNLDGIFSDFGYMFTR